MRGWNFSRNQERRVFGTGQGKYPVAVIRFKSRDRNIYGGISKAAFSWNNCIVPFVLVQLV